jgi:hypothetical protein
LGFYGCGTFAICEMIGRFFNRFNNDRWPGVARILKTSEPENFMNLCLKTVAKMQN